MPHTKRRVKRRPTGAQPSTHRNNAITSNSTENGTPFVAQGKLVFDCAVCGGAGQLTVEARIERGAWRGKWWVNCWKAECKALSGEYLHSLAEAVGAPGGSALLADPLRYLGEPAFQSVPGRKPAPLPTTAELAGWQSRLWSDAAALKWLRNKRGLTNKTIREARIGYDGEAFVIPIRNADGKLVNVVRRGWPNVLRDRAGKSKKYMVLPGRTRRNGGVQLYPRPRAEDAGAWLLVGGLLDAVLGRQHGLPCVSGTHGVDCWLPEWDKLVRKRRIAVMYDVGEERAMEARVTGLREAGAYAWPVHLREAMERGKDLTDWFVSGRSVEELISLINHERAASRRRGGLAA